MVYGAKERSNHRWVLRRGDTCQDYSLRARGDCDDEWAETAVEDVGGLHLVLGTHRLPADQRVHSAFEATARGEQAAAKEFFGGEMVVSCGFHVGLFHANCNLNGPLCC